MKVNPETYIKAIAANRAAGIPAATQNAVRALKKTNNRIKTRPKPCKPLLSKICNRLEIRSARVLESSILTPSEKLTFFF